MKNNWHTLVCKDIGKFKLLYLRNYSCQPDKMKFSVQTRSFFYFISFSLKLIYGLGFYDDFDFRKMSITELAAANFEGRLNIDTSPQNFWTTFLENDLLTEKLKKSAVANAIAIPLPLCFFYLVLLRRFRENLPKPFYFYVTLPAILRR